MKKYEQPNVNIVVFECEDVIKTSPISKSDGDFNPGNGYSHDDGIWL